MSSNSGHYAGHIVALLAEGVDRNQSGIDFISLDQVALLAEGVDRNTNFLPTWSLFLIVAQKSFGSQLMSPSLRRAWIEICRA